MAKESNVWAISYFYEGMNRENFESENNVPRKPKRRWGNLTWKLKKTFRLRLITIWIKIRKTYNLCKLENKLSHVMRYSTSHAHFY